jgi:voltage-gated potassium channel
VSIIAVTIYKLLIAVISLLYLYFACVIHINIKSSILINTICLIFIHLFRSYGLFYICLMAQAVVSYRYYKRRKGQIGTGELFGIYVLNITGIAVSLYALLKMVYYYPARFPLQKQLPFVKIPFIEITPIIYMMMIYFTIIILILSINNHLASYAEDNSQSNMTKTTAAAISVVLIIITANAVIYFIIHNFPSKELYGIFEGNFLKDPVKYYYRLPKRFSDCLWFSATTFFTVGYGDMHPVGNIMYLVSMMEMISAYVLGIIMIPILLLKVSK